MYSIGLDSWKYIFSFIRLNLRKCFELCTVCKYWNIEMLSKYTFVKIHCKNLPKIYHLSNFSRLSIVCDETNKYFYTHSPNVNSLEIIDGTFMNLTSFTRCSELSIFLTNIFQSQPNIKKLVVGDNNSTCPVTLFNIIEIGDFLFSFIQPHLKHLSNIRILFLRHCEWEWQIIQLELLPKLLQVIIVGFDDYTRKLIFDLKIKNTNGQNIQIIGLSESDYYSKYIRNT